jgi:endonuclease/exonuclease/phosphatase family metal-dependent hydrolase
MPSVVNKEPCMPSAHSSDTGSIRVATLNIYGHQGGWNERRPVLVEGFKKLNADIIALQEAIVIEGYDQVREILGDDYAILHQEGRSADGYGQSIASRWPARLVHRHSLWVSERMALDHSPIGTMAIHEIDVPGWRRPLLFVHYKPTWERPYERERELQAVMAARVIDEVVGDRDVHVIVAGDLDAVPDSASMRFWRGLQALDGESVYYEDAWEAVHPDGPGLTFSPENPLVRTGEMPLERGRRIDYILVRGGDHGSTLDITACERLFDTPVDGVWASDHFGVRADFMEPPGG